MYRSQLQLLTLLESRIAGDFAQSLLNQATQNGVQSQMLASDPNFLVLSYTRTMMAFMLFNKEPKRIAMIGLGGGSMSKWCYHELPKTDIAVIEINQMVVSLRDKFYIPE